MTSELSKMMAEMDFPVVPVDNPDTENRQEIPFASLTAMGIAFEPLVGALQSVFGSSETAAQLYQVTLPVGATHLAKLKNESANIGAAFDDVGNLIGQARLTPASGAAVSFNPATAAMAVALVSIEKKLGDIQELQEEMMSFMKARESSKQTGNMKFLQSLLEEYKYNWNNELFVNNSQVKVLDIKQSAMQNLDFYKILINEVLAKRALLTTNRDVRKQLKKLRENFEDYQVAQYLFAFSSFMDIMLKETFEEEYLAGVVDTIRNYSYEYKEMYTKAYDQIEHMADKTLQANLMGAASFAGKGLGKLVEKTPVGKHTQIDEKLQDKAERVDDRRDEGVQRFVRKMAEHQDSQTKPFIDSINIINSLYNTPLELVFDKGHLYLPVTESVSASEPKSLGRMLR